MITIDIKNPNVRHVPQTSPLAGRTEYNYLNWRTLASVFVIQFLYSQLILSYGTYTVYFVQEDVPLMEAIWPVALYMGCCKIFHVLFRNVTKYCYKKYFRLMMFLGTVTTSAGLSMCVLFSSPDIMAVFYGAIAAIGTSLVMSLLRNQLYLLPSYQSQLLLGIQHVAMASSVLASPHFLNFLLKNSSSTHRALLLHGAIILHALPAGLFLYRKHSKQQELTVYINTGNLYEEEMTDMSNTDNNSFEERSWKSPSDNAIFKDNEVDIEEQTPSFRLQKQETISGVELLPQIPEEDEDELEETSNTFKRNSMIVNDNIRKLSVMSLQLEEIIHHNEDRRSPVENNCNSETCRKKINRNYKIPQYANDNTVYTSTECVCCRNYIWKCDTQYCFEAFLDTFVTPLCFSFTNIKFYLSLITNIHSMISPLIFFNFLPLKGVHLMNLTLTESFFLVSIAAFAYLAFIMTLPWIVEIPRQYFRFVYMGGCVITTFAIYLIKSTDTDKYIVIGCLVYGFGLGIECYMRENVVSYLIGAYKWSKIQGTLESFTGAIFLIIIYYTKDMFLDSGSLHDYIRIWFHVLLLSHLIVALLWISIPVMKYVLNKLKK